MSQPASLRLALMETLGGPVFTQEVKGHVPDYRQVFRSISGPYPAFVFPEGEVQHPMEAILDSPMASSCLEQSSGIRLQTGYVVPGFHRHLVSSPSLRRHHPDASQPRPIPSGLDVGQLLRVVNRPTRRVSMRPWPVWQKSLGISSNPALCPQENKSSSPPATSLDFP